MPARGRCFILHYIAERYDWIVSADKHLHTRDVTYLSLSKLSKPFTFFTLYIISLQERIKLRAMQRSYLHVSSLKLIEFFKENIFFKCKFSVCLNAPQLRCNVGNN